MLLLIFEVEGGRYALATERVVEVVPMVALRKIPFTDDYVAGLMNYRGRPVPVIDLCRVTGGRPCTPKYSTRIILVNQPVKNKPDAIIGLIAEQVTETTKSSLTTAPSSGMVIDDSLFQTRSKPAEYEMVRWFDLEQMLPLHKFETLF
jgi:chemotaxis-related protein WspB